MRCNVSPVIASNVSIPLGHIDNFRRCNFLFDAEIQREKNILSIMDSVFLFQILVLKCGHSPFAADIIFLMALAVAISDLAA